MTIQILYITCDRRVRCHVSWGVTSKAYAVLKDVYLLVNHPQASCTAPQFHLYSPCYLHSGTTSAIAVHSASRMLRGRSGQQHPSECQRELYLAWATSHLCVLAIDTSANAASSSLYNVYKDVLVVLSYVLLWASSIAGDL